MDFIFCLQINMKVSTSWHYRFLQKWPDMSKVPKRKRKLVIFIFDILLYGDSVMFVVTCSISNDSTQMVTISNLIPDYDSHTPNLSDLFFLTLVFVIQWLFLHCESIVLLSQFTLSFPQTRSGWGFWLHTFWLALWSP